MPTWSCEKTLLISIQCVMGVRNECICYFCNMFFHTSFKNLLWFLKDDETYMFKKEKYNPKNKPLICYLHLYVLVSH